MGANKNTRSLLEELKQLAEIGTAADFSMLRDSESFPAQERDIVIWLQKVLDKYKASFFHREKMLDILNRVALVLLTRGEKKFADAMSEGLGLIAGIADIDRMSIFRNSTGPDGSLHLSQIYRWSQDAHGTVQVREELEDVPYADFSPLLEPILTAGESLSGQVGQMAGNETFTRFGCVTILAIPVFDDGKFWGFAFFERFQEKNFTEQETEVLRSASFMLASAVIRNEEALAVRRAREQSQLMLAARDEMLMAQAQKISQANEQIQSMLDSIPMAITIWDRDHKVLNCSQYAVDLLGYSTKQELIEQAARNVPEYQPGGKLSWEVMTENSAEAFRTGSSRVEWALFTASGEPMLLDAQAIRIKHDDDYLLMLCSRDIREERRMLSDLAERDKMLAAQAHWYKSILDGIPLPLSVTDNDMKLTFTNTAAKNIFGQSSGELIGQHCSIWNCPICNTENCSVVRAKQGHKQSFFKIGGISCKVDTEMLYDLAGDAIGYLEILHDVTEVEKLARRQAEAANEAKSAFLATMSHEMRTPLTAVLGLSELVLENGGLSRENELYLDKIFNAGSTLLTIVNDILDISKIEAGKFEIVPREYDVPSLINDVITHNILRLHSKPVHFSLNINENVPVRLYGDDIRVKQIVSNLLSNAFKYTDAGTVELRIDYEREGDSVWTTFQVSDTGIGIRPEDVKLLFADYTRFDGEANRQVGGTGLGLSITKRLVGLMDGAITAESEYGRGSVFTAKIRQQFVSGLVVGSEMAEHLRKFQYTASKRSSGSQLNRVKLPYARVLVVDDNLTNLDIAKGLMRPYGMEIDCVTSGRAAIEAIRTENSRYNAIFMDHMMPGMDGVEATRLIREEIGSEYAKTVPIIALTANAVAGSKERFISQGFDAFVSKPIDIFRLDAVIRRLIWDKDQDRRRDDSQAFADRRKRADRRQSGERRIDERRNSALMPASAGVIAGFDWMRGIELFGGEDSYRQVLRSFAVNTRPLLESLAEVHEDALSPYAVTVHGLKSSSRGICAKGLGHMAESLEFAAKDGNFDFVRRRNPGFRAAARKLIEDIEALLQTAAEAKPQKDRPDDDELERLCAACDNYDLNGIDAVMQEIDEYEYTADGGLADWLRDNIARLNYAQVAEKIIQERKMVQRG